MKVRRILTLFAVVFTFTPTISQERVDKEDIEIIQYSKSIRKLEYWEYNNYKGEWSQEDKIGYRDKIRYFRKWQEAGFLKTNHKADSLRLLYIDTKERYKACEEGLGIYLYRSVYVMTEEQYEDLKNLGDNDSLSIRFLAHHEGFIPTRVCIKEYPYDINIKKSREILEKDTYSIRNLLDKEVDGKYSSDKVLEIYRYEGVYRFRLPVPYRKLEEIEERERINTLRKEYREGKIRQKEYYNRLTSSSYKYKGGGEKEPWEWYLEVEEKEFNRIFKEE